MHQILLITEPKFVKIHAKKLTISWSTLKLLEKRIRKTSLSFHVHNLNFNYLAQQKYSRWLEKCRTRLLLKTIKFMYSYDIQDIKMYGLLHRLTWQTWNITGYKGRPFAKGPSTITKHFFQDMGSWKVLPQRTLSTTQSSSWWIWMGTGVINQYAIRQYVIQCEN